MENKKKRVLFVDDHLVILETFAVLLVNKGLVRENIVTCGDGQEAFSRLQVDPYFNLVISDLNMPRMDGVELIKAMRKNPSLKDIPFVLASMSNISDMGRELYQELGVNMVLKKEKLSDRIEEILGLAH